LLGALPLVAHDWVGIRFLYPDEIARRLKPIVNFSRASCEAGWRGLRMFRFGGAGG
jgi:hypothetical protein